MLKQLLNECVIELMIEPDGPILVKSGRDTVRGPNMAFVRTWRNGQEEVYLPGSSLKGVLRSHAERITRTLGEYALLR
jgi:CRISPR/Cas system CSM-associated protein Csm3 (group 7 of RAMP superfamily)